LLIHPKGRGWGVALLSSFFWIRAALHFRGTACWCGVVAYRVIVNMGGWNHKLNGQNLKNLEVVQR